MAAVQTSVSGCAASRARRPSGAETRKIACAAGGLEGVDGGDGAAAGGQHGVDQQRGAAGDIAVQALVVGLRLQGLLVAAQADHADRGRGQQHLHAGQEAQAGAEDGHEGDSVLVAAADIDRAGPGVDAARAQRKVGGSFVGEQGGDLADHLAEQGRAGGGVAQQAELVGDERMADFDGLHGDAVGGGSAAKGSRPPHHGSVRYRMA